MYLIYIVFPGIQDDTCNGSLHPEFLRMSRSHMASPGNQTLRLSKKQGIWEMCWPIGSLSAKL